MATAFDHMVRFFIISKPFESWFKTLFTDITIEEFIQNQSKRGIIQKHASFFARIFENFSTSWFLRPWRLAIPNSKNFETFWTTPYNHNGPIDFESPYDYDLISGTSKVGKYFKTWLRSDPEQQSWPSSFDEEFYFG